MTKPLSHDDQHTLSRRLAVVIGAPRSLTQRDLADLFQVEFETVNRWVRKYHPPRQITLLASFMIATPLASWPEQPKRIAQRIAAKHTARVKAQMRRAREERRKFIKPRLQLKKGYVRQVGGGYIKENAK